MFECNRRSKADTASGNLIFYGSDVYAPINKIATAESIQLCERGAIRVFNLALSLKSFFSFSGNGKSFSWRGPILNKAMSLNIFSKSITV